MLQTAMPPRFRLTPPALAESELHEACAQALDKLLLPPALWFTYPAGHIQLSPAEAARLTRVGLKRGLPDIWLLFQGLVFTVELKSRDGKLSKTRIGRTRSGAPRIYVGQTDVFPQLMAAGAAVAVAHSVEEMLAQVLAWGIPMRPLAAPIRPKMLPALPAGTRGRGFTRLIS